MTVLEARGNARSEYQVRFSHEVVATEETTSMALLLVHATDVPISPNPSYHWLGRRPLGLIGLLRRSAKVFKARVWTLQPLLYYETAFEQQKPMTLVFRTR